MCLYCAEVKEGCGVVYLLGYCKEVPVFVRGVQEWYELCLWELYLVCEVGLLRLDVLWWMLGWEGV